jgi:precorrin-4/cobalt-precorrin-4 C11-methyltransferase
VKLIDSAGLELGEITDKMIGAARAGLSVVRLQTGDPTFYGALAEQAEILDAAGVDYEVVPGVSSAFASAAALRTSLTRPGITQSVIFTRLEGRTRVPDGERLKNLASHGATLCIFLSSAMIDKVAAELISGGCTVATPAAVVYRASWPDELVLTGTLGDIADKARMAGITKHAMILVGEALGKDAAGVSRAEASKLYDKGFSHGYRSVR